MKTLYDTLVELGLQEPDAIFEPSSTHRLEDTVLLTGRTFAKAVLESIEFRTYIVDGLLEKTLAPAILLRLMDHGWGKPTERVEHTGANGAAIVTEVRRVLVHVNGEIEALDDQPREPKQTMH